jgi:hypothetical protein
MSSILADNTARTPAFWRKFGAGAILPGSSKDRLTNDFRDNWTVGYHPDLAVGVLVNNASITPHAEHQRCERGSARSGTG